MKFFFPVLLIFLDFAAAVVYGYYLDWRHCIYWLAAAILTITITV